MSDGPDAAGGLDGDADGGFDMGFDTDFGGIDGLDGAGGLDSDFISDSIMISFDHDEAWSDALCDESMGSVIEIDQPHKHGKALTEEQRRMLDKIRNDPNRKFFGTHIINHGFVDVAVEFRRIATELGCVRIDQLTPNFTGSDSIIHKLADWNRWSEPFLREKMPSGWYEGAKGSTRIFRQFWQLEKGFFHPEKETRFDRFAGMVLDVVAVTWHYKEPGDYETRFQIMVKTLPEYSDAEGGWGIRQDPFRRYQPKADELNERMARALSLYRPDPWCKQIRQDILDRLKRENEPAPVECTETVHSGADIQAALEMPPESGKYQLPIGDPNWD